MIHVKKTLKTDQTEMRHAYCSALIAAAQKDDRIVALDCDLSGSCGTGAFYAAFPDRAFNLGIQEQNICAMAGGMSVSGLIPFVHTFAVFTSRRMFDQAFISCAYARANVKLIGCDAGVSAAANGGTHMAFEDVGLMRMIPNAIVVEPSDCVMMQKLVPQIAEHYGTVYLRMPRKEVVSIYEEDSEFTLGKGAVLREGTDVTIIACGMEVCEALWAADILAQEGISACVVDMFTVKPADEELIIACARKTGAIVTAENANVLGGLAAAVSEVTAQHCPVPMELVGVQDLFGEVGDISYLKSRFGLTAADIADKVRKVLARKTSSKENQK